MEKSEEMNERLVSIKGALRTAQLQTQRFEDGDSTTEIRDAVTARLELAQTYSNHVPPIGRMVNETLQVWLLVSDGPGFQRNIDWLTGTTFAMIAAIDFLLEVDA